ncbi:unnamed protein product, partial [Effrenium voratum]
MSESFSWVRAAAAALRAKTRGRLTEAWEVDLEAAIWKCHGQNLADVDLEAGEVVRGRAVFESGSSLRRGSTPAGARRKAKASASFAERGRRFETPRREAKAASSPFPSCPRSFAPQAPAEALDSTEPSAKAAPA